MRPFRPALLALCVALAACQSVDVQPAKPSLKIPAQWRSTVGPTSQAEAVWWRNFHDSQLNQYVDQALRYNSDILIARERVNEYQARVFAAEGSLVVDEAGTIGIANPAISRRLNAPVDTLQGAHVLD